MLAGLAVAVLAGGLVTACNTSPYAAVVNGDAIAQTALNQELSYGDRSLAYLELVESIHQQATGQTVGLSGAGSGTHTKAWVALQLTGLIQDRLISQDLAARHQQPGTAMLDAARGVLEAEMTPAGIVSVPAAFRDELVARIARHAEIEPASGASAAGFQQLYSHYRADFYTQVCVRHVTVSVLSPGGGVDYARSLADARTIASSFDSTAKVPAAGSGLGQVNNGYNCYSQAEMQAMPVSFVKTVMGLAPGRAAPPRRTGLGYQVIAVVSRRTEPFAGPVARALEAVILQRQPQLDGPLLALEHKAHVKVDSAYGTWTKGSRGVAPGVIPPSVSPSTPGS